MAAWGMILTCDKLRGLILIDWCCIYRHSGEDVDHLVVHCEEISKLWSLLLQLLESLGFSQRRCVIY